jgi:hypothetical protein
MKKHTLFTIILLAAAMLLSACSGAPSATQAAPAAATQVVSIPQTSVGYPAPAGVLAQPQAQGGYPAPGVIAQPNVPAAGYPAPGGGLQVTGADGKAKAIAIGAIAKVKVSVNGSSMDLRKLSDVLNAAGIASAKQATVVGSNGKMTLTTDQLAKAYLDVAADGTIKLVVDGVQPDQWISGVTQVTAQ